MIVHPSCRTVRSKSPLLVQRQRYILYVQACAADGRKIPAATEADRRLPRMADTQTEEPRMANSVGRFDRLPTCKKSPCPTPYLLKGMTYREVSLWADTPPASTHTF